jgi:hypothetical protein
LLQEALSALNKLHCLAVTSGSWFAAEAGVDTSHDGCPVLPGERGAFAARRLWIRAGESGGGPALVVRNP